MAWLQKKPISYVLAPGPGQVIDYSNACTAILTQTVTPNLFREKDNLKLTEQGSDPATLEPLSDVGRPRSQFFVYARTNNRIFAVKCIASYKDEQRQRNIHDQGYYETLELRAYTRLTNPRQKQIKSHAIWARNESALEDYEVQNHVRYILDGYQHVLSLCGFARWTSFENNEPNFFMLYYEYCNQGTLLDYAKRCYRERKLAVESFITSNVSLQLLSAIKWLQSEDFVAHRPSLLHRNIRLENVFLHKIGENGWPIVKLGGLEMLTPIAGSVREVKSVGEPGPWDPPEFPTYSVSSDLWGVGAVIYAALTQGRPPPKDTAIARNQIPDDRYLEPYTKQTQSILGSLRVTNPSARYSIGELMNLITNEADSIQDQEHASSWDSVDEEPQIRLDDYIKDFMAWLEAEVHGYLANLHSLACQNTYSLDAKDVALLDIDEIRDEACKALGQWCHKVLGEGGANLQDEIEDRGYFLALNIHSFLKSAGDELWYQAHAQYLAVPPLRRGKTIGTEQHIPAIIGVRIQSFIAHVEPLVEDVFWKTVRTSSKKHLYAYSDEELINKDESSPEDVEYARSPVSEHSDSESDIPSKDKIAGALQTWFIEKYYQGILACAKVEENLMDESWSIEISSLTIADILKLPKIWSSGETIEPVKTWCKHVEQCFEVSWKMSKEGLEGRKQPLDVSVLAGLYRAAESFARETIAISTDCIRVKQSERKQSSYRKLTVFLKAIQMHWKDSWQLDLKTGTQPIVRPEDDVLSRPPSFNSIELDLQTIDHIKSRNLEDLKRQRPFWTKGFKQKMKALKTPTVAQLEKYPEEFGPEAEALQARKFATTIVLPIDDTLVDGLDPQLRQDIATGAAYTYMRLEMQASQAIFDDYCRDRIENGILDALWPVDYAAAVCYHQRHAFQEIVHSSLVNSGTAFRGMNQHPSKSKFDRQVINFENRISASLAILRQGLGFSEDDDQIDDDRIDTGVAILVQGFENSLKEWRNQSAHVTQETLERAAQDFAVACDHYYDRAWARFRQNYVLYIVRKLNPSAIPPAAPVIAIPVVPPRRFPPITIPARKRTEAPAPTTKRTIRIKLGKPKLPEEEPPTAMVGQSFNAAAYTNSRKVKRRIGRYPSPRTKVQRLSDEDTDWGWSDLGENGSWPNSPSSSSSSSPSPSPPPSRPTKKEPRDDGDDEYEDRAEESDDDGDFENDDADDSLIVQAKTTTKANTVRPTQASPTAPPYSPITPLKRKIARNDGGDDEYKAVDDSYDDDDGDYEDDLDDDDDADDSFIVKTKTTPKAKSVRPAQNSDSPSSNIRSRKNQKTQHAANSATTAEAIDIPRQDWMNLNDPQELEFEALIAHANIDWPLETSEHKARLFAAEAIRSKIFVTPGQPLPWEPARRYNVLPNPSEMRLKIITDDGRRVVAERVWHRTIGSYPVAFPFSSPLRPSRTSPGGAQSSTPARNQPPTTVPLAKWEQKDPVQSREPRRSNKAIAQDQPNVPSRKRTSPFPSEGAAKRRKTRELAYDSPSWRGMGTALAEVIPGATIFAKAAGKFAKLFSASPPDKTKPPPEEPSSSSSDDVPSSKRQAMPPPRKPPPAPTTPPPPKRYYRKRALSSMLTSSSSSEDTTLTTKGQSKRARIEEYKRFEATFPPVRVPWDPRAPRQAPKNHGFPNYYPSSLRHRNLLPASLDPDLADPESHQDVSIGSGGVAPSSNKKIQRLLIKNSHLEKQKLIAATQAVLVPASGTQKENKPPKIKYRRPLRSRSKSAQRESELAEEVPIVIHVEVESPDAAHPTRLPDLDGRVFMQRRAALQPLQDRTSEEDLALYLQHEEEVDASDEDIERLQRLLNLAETNPTNPDVRMALENENARLQRSIRRWHIERATGEVSSSSDDDSDANADADVVSPDDEKLDSVREKVVRVAEKKRVKEKSKLSFVNTMS